MLDDVLVLLRRDLPAQHAPITLVQVADIERIPGFGTEGRTVDRSSTGEDGSPVDEDRRSIIPGRGDHTGRHVLVTRRDEDRTVVPVGFDIHLERVGDDVPARERVEHAVVAHTDVVTTGSPGGKSCGVASDDGADEAGGQGGGGRWTDLTPGTAVWKPTMLACSTPVLTISPRSLACTLHGLPFDSSSNSR